MLSAMTLPSGLPSSVTAFARRFTDEAGCARHLAELRWSGGFACRRCGGAEAWQLAARPRVFECRGCGAQNSVTAGTVMHRSKVSLVEWFWAAWALSQDKRGVSALQLSKQLGRRYETVWQLLHKLRAALDEDDKAFPLQGVVEVDEVYLGGKAPAGKGGRSLADPRRSLVACAVERRETAEGEPGIRGTGIRAGAARFIALPAANREGLQGFLKAVCASGAMVRSDGWSGYSGLPMRGLGHQRVVVGSDSARASELLPLVHTLFSNLRAWLDGTFHGVSRKWLPRYLQEFRWRFNRRVQEPRLWCYLLRRAMRKPWRTQAELPTVAPALQAA